MLLIAVAPVVYLVGLLRNERHQRFYAVGRLEADPQLLKQSEPVQGQRLLKPFIQTIDRRSVDLL